MYCSMKAMMLAAALGVAAVSGAFEAQAAGGQAARDSAEDKSAEELARQGAESLMQALERLLDAVPRYGVPRVEEDGDIVIPRLDPPREGGGDELPAVPEWKVIETRV